MIRTALAPKPLIVAALVGAAVYGLVSRKGWSDLAKGAAVGAAVQIAVRVAGVS